MTVVNLTPHPITLRTAAGDETIPSSGVARCTPAPAVATDEGLPVPVARPGGPMGPVVGLPSPAPGAVYIVSAMVLAHPDCAGRKDVLAPGTGPADGAIRDGAGHIVAVTRLVGVAL